eukprot:TRINITY_DN4158_c0_g1_i1.p1 TRINITY_DN4158_c0_g1~~TRINITY_DN4158_c0_g1_i1.p1  ORF type:complete len:144 (+),score=34.55 TRINITY_DN4158_c0_g1_i1:54-434(+)
MCIRDSLRSCSERSGISALRVDDALLNTSRRLALFGRLEQLVSAAEDGVKELSWLQKNIMNRSAGEYARQVVSAINDLQTSLNGSAEWGHLSYLMTLNHTGDTVHLKAIQAPVSYTHLTLPTIYSV